MPKDVLSSSNASIPVVAYSIKKKNAFYFPSRAVKRPDAEGFISENVASVLLPVGNGKSPTFHNQCHLNDARIVVLCNCAVNILHLHLCVF